MLAFRYGGRLYGYYTRYNKKGQVALGSFLVCDPSYCHQPFGPMDTGPGDRRQLGTWSTLAT